MSKYLNTGKYKSRVVKRTYGDGSVRCWLQTSVVGLAFQDRTPFNNLGAALLALDNYKQEKAREHVVSEEVVG